MSNNNELTWLFGIEKFFNYINESEKKKFIRNIINLKYSTAELRPWPLKDLISTDYQTYPDTGREERLVFYTNVCSKDVLTTIELIEIMFSIWPKDDLIQKLHKITKLEHEKILPIIFSKSQILGKIWMGEILSKFQLDFKSILLVGGWLTHHSLFLKDINFSQLYSIDPDSSINDLVSIINPTALVSNNTMNDCIIDGNITFKNNVIKPDLIINTSAEHMDDYWFNSLRPGTRILIQSNNSSFTSEHTNPSASFSEFLKKYQMSEVFYRGEMKFPNYVRYMIYGIK